MPPSLYGVYIHYICGIYNTLAEAIKDLDTHRLAVIKQKLHKHNWICSQKGFNIPFRCEGQQSHWSAPPKKLGGGGGE